MTKKVALITLIKNSILLPNETKLELLARVATMGDDEVEAFGKFLTAERQFALQNESQIKFDASQIIESFNTVAPVAALAHNEMSELPEHAVLVGSGKPNK